MSQTSPHSAHCGMRATCSALTGWSLGREPERRARSPREKAAVRRPSGERLGLHQVDATRPRILRCREGAEGRRLRFAPQPGPFPGESWVRTEETLGKWSIRLTTERSCAP